MDITQATTTTTFVAVLIHQQCEAWRAEAREAFDAIIKRSGGCVYCGRGIPVSYRSVHVGHADLDQFVRCTNGRLLTADITVGEADA